MKRTAMFFVSLMMVVMVSAQSSYDFMFNNVTVPSATKTNVKSVSVNQLAQASARRSGNTRTATRRNATMTATAQTAQQTAPQYTETQQQVMNMANAQQKVVLTGEVTNVYMNGWELILTVRTPGLYGGKYDYALRGYNSNIEIQRGDKIYFAATYTGTSLPEILPTEFLDYTGMQRYMTETANLYYGGNYGLMLSSNGQMSKYQKALMNITGTALTLATLVQVVKSIF